MRLGFVGLGRMGGNMVARLRRDGHEVVAFDADPAAVARAEAVGARGVDSLDALVAELAPPRRVWIMVPAGDAVEATVDALADRLAAGDLIVDGGNSNFHDTRRRGAALAARGLRFADVGVSGGVWGLELGYCMMVGGEPDDVAALAPVLDTLAPTPDGGARRDAAGGGAPARDADAAGGAEATGAAPRGGSGGARGWLHVGPVGAGHYVKMVHNGIEYGMLQAYGEGFEILKNSPDFEFELGEIARLWNQGSVIRSWLLELAERAFADGDDLEGVRGYVEDSGEGRWTVQEAIDQSTPAPVLTLSLLARFASRQDDSYAAKVIAALRREFGGHAVRDAQGRVPPAGDAGRHPRA